MEAKSTAGAHRARRRRHARRDRRAEQAPRVHLPVVGDLRRARLDLRLRPLRRAAQEQRQGRVVAGDDRRARRHRRARLGDPPAPAHVGGLRAPRGVHRPARRLPHVQAAVPRRQARATPQCGRKPSKHPGETDDCDLTDARQFNLMFETHMGPVRDDASTVYLRPETAQGIFVNFKNVLQFARRKPPFGIAQVGKSFRNEITPGQLHLPHARVRADGDGVLRAPRTRPRRWFEYWLERAPRAGTPSSASAPTTCGCASIPTRSCRTTPRRPRTSSTCSRSAGRSSRGSPTAATSTSASTPSSRARSSSTSTSRAASATSRT